VVAAADALVRAFVGAGVRVIATTGAEPAPASVTSPEPRAALPPTAARATRAAIVTSPLALRLRILLPGPLVIGSP
jgi:hypothetical protein